MSPTSSSSWTPRGTRARAASACRARSAWAAVRTCAASPRDARAAQSSRASVTPLIADTTTTCGDGRYATTIVTACATPAAFASEAPPNLWMCGGEPGARGMASVRLVAAGGAGGVKRLRGDAAGLPGPHHRVTHGPHAIGDDHRDDGRPRAGERRPLRARLPRRSRHLVVTRHERATERDVEHVVEPGGGEAHAGMRQAVDQGGALRGRPHRVRMRQCR